MPTPALETIKSFLSVKRIAMVGLSRDPKDFSVWLFEQLVHRGYDMVPVNPNAASVLRRPCFARVQDIQPPVEAALLMTSADVTDSVVADCAKAGIRRIWLYRAGGKGAVTPSAVAFCQEHGIEVVPGECPFMFLPHNGLHAIHGFVNKVLGRYPKRQAA
jgi:predicted CoA-binding protein